MVIRKLYKTVTPYIQDSQQDLYDCVDNILYIVYDEYLSDNKYIFDCIWSIISLCGFVTCVLHVMNVSIWIGQETIPQPQQHCKPL